MRPDEVGAANSLLQFIHDENIKLIVAGAYGHSRLGEWHLRRHSQPFGGEPICSLFSQ